MRGDSPRGGEMSQSDRGDRALFALDAKRPEGWFLTTNPKNIHSKAQQNVLSERHMSQTIGTVKTVPYRTFYHVLPPPQNSRRALRPQARFGGQPNHRFGS